MEKIININLQGRVIPIEETAYNGLKQYIDSLRSYFDKEEGKEEIINDIENRIAELLSYRLKQGATCINNNDLGAIINSIGKLEDIEAAEGEEPTASAGGSTANSYASTSQRQAAPVGNGRFYRNADDKVIAGVCSGIANRMGVDPVVVRILFVLLMGAFFWIYILMWIIVPSQSAKANVTRRLYRNPDDKVIAGVCGGLAVYFNVSSWVPRLIFVLPFFVGIMSRVVFSMMWHWYWGMGPRIFTGSFGSTLFILYIILWIALPFASSATDKMEMRGEKIDINSIKAASQARGPVAPRRYGSGLGRVIGILFKAFFMFIAGIMALSLFGVLIGLVFSSFVTMPLSNFFLDGWGQNMLAWCGLTLFLGIPLLAIITWIVRRLIGVRSHRHYLGYVFAGLWIIGVIGIVMLTGLFIRNFNAKSSVDEPIAIQQPSTGKMFINVTNSNTPSFVHYHRQYRWFHDWDDDGSAFHMVNKDSLWLNNVKVNVSRSPDSLYHIYETKISRGQTSEDAKSLAAHIAFDVRQQDSIITLPAGFPVSSRDKFRNQQVMVTVEVPVGKEIELSDEVRNYSWYNINVRRQRNFYIEHSWDDNERWHSGRHYHMGPSGLESSQDNKHGKNNNDDDNDEE